MAKSRDWNKLYDTYKRTYDKKAAKSPVAMTEKLSLYEFRSAYKILEIGRQQEISAGTRKVANVTQDIVASQQLYAVSQRQAKAIKSALINLDIQLVGPQPKGHKTPSIQAIRKGTDKQNEAFWDMVREYRRQTAGDPYALTVGQMFFNSP